MRILADENMPGLDCWSQAGHDVVTMPGRVISSDSLAETDVLLVRSVTQVNRELLEHSPVRFVGTATSGMDHIDRQYLDQAGIVFAAAAGANARSVTDYVFSVLAALCLDHGFDWLNSRTGIIGGGNVGGLLCRQLSALGANVALYDPFLSGTSEYAPYLCDLDTVLTSDLVTLHTPLTVSGPHPTFHMIDHDVIEGFGADQVLINTARGEVVDNKALLSRLVNNPFRAVLDVWEGEPAISPGLADRVVLATPHIAGYSADSKIRATRMLFDAFKRWSGTQQNSESVNEQSAVNELHCEEAAKEPTLCRQLSSVLLQAYDVREDDNRLRREISDCKDEAAVSHSFDWQRKHYPVRREFTAFSLKGGLFEKGKELAAKLSALGFASG